MASAIRKTDDYGRRCLLARRMVENGVRFVCVVSGGGSGDTEWDAHSDIEENHIRMAALDRQARRGADQRSEAARPARFDHRAVGRRIRPIAGIGRSNGPRSSQHRLHDVARRRRLQRRHGLRRDRRHRTQGRREPGPLPRSARDDAAPVGSESGPAQLHASGSQGAAHRSSRASYQRDRCLKAGARGGT